MPSTCYRWLAGPLDMACGGLGFGPASADQVLSSSRTSWSLRERSPGPLHSCRRDCSLCLWALCTHTGEACGGRLADVYQHVTHSSCLTTVSPALDSL